ncbi:MAG TPA: TlpA disulfide reductase family protein [Bacteroidia bacterium]|nr:TlpA disulfide reductase family protein [Bacteroidia bacterium]
MKTGFKIVLLAFLFGFTQTEKKVEVVTFGQLQEQADLKNNDTVYVVNFWATWCGPCVKEMPFFENASQTFATQKVKILYVCLNSVKELASVERFVENKKIQNRVMLLNAPNPNDWIDRVDPAWSGSIPATIMYKGGEKVFFKEGSFTQQELDETITKMNTNIIINTEQK